MKGFCYKCHKVMPVIVTKSQFGKSRLIQCVQCRSEIKKVITTKQEIKACLDFFKPL